MITKKTEYQKTFDPLRVRGVGTFFVGLRKACQLSICTLFLFSNLAYAQTGTASFYGVEACKYNPYEGCPMANGRSLYEAPDNYAAMWGLPFNTKVKVCLRDKPLICTESIILDRGPNVKKYPDRVIDLSPTSFKKLSPLTEGLINVTVEVQQSQEVL